MDFGKGDFEMALVGVSRPGALLTFLPSIWFLIVKVIQTHPNALQAKRRAGRLSRSDQRELRRIASLVRAVNIKKITAPAEHRQNAANGRYSEMWRNWLKTKEHDVIISFE